MEDGPIMGISSASRIFSFYAAKKVLEDYEDKFKEVMDLQTNVLGELSAKGIISKGDKQVVQAMADPGQQNGELFSILKSKCTDGHALEIVCDIIIAAGGGYAMTKLGKDMKDVLTISKYCVLCIPLSALMQMFGHCSNLFAYTYVVYVCVCVNVHVSAHGGTDCNYQLRI